MKSNPFYAAASSPNELNVRIDGVIKVDRKKLSEAQRYAKEHGANGWCYANYLLTGAISFNNEREFFEQFWDEGENLGS